MPSGPLPSAQKRRRNKPTIPTSMLPAGGRTGPTPDPPSWVDLGPAGQAWWEWAWHTPQAAGWSPEAHLDAVAKRASLEDDLRTIESEDLSALSEEDLRSFVERLKGLVTGRSTVLTRIKDYDDRLGLTPKSMAQLRWEIRSDEPAAEAGPKDEVSDRRRKREERLAAEG